LTRSVLSSAASAVSAVESIPPDSRTPTGTSLMRWARTESRRRSRSVLLDDQLAGLGAPDEALAGAQLSGLAEDRQRRRDRVGREVGLERIEIDLTGEVRMAQQRLELRGEGEMPAVVPVVERLDPEAVARHDQASLALVPDRDREHAPQILDEGRSALLVQVGHRFGVAAGAEPVSAGLQPGLDLAMVVDLAVLDDVDAPILVRQRLAATLEVDDGQAARGEPHRPADDGAPAVRAPVQEGSGHPGQDVAIDIRAVQRHEAGDTAHGASLPAARLLGAHGRAAGAARMPPRRQDQFGYIQSV
jgi:hypothetical protein